MKGYVRYMLTWTDKDGIMFSAGPETAKPMRWFNLGDWCSTGGELPPDDDGPYILSVAMCRFYCKGGASTGKHR